MARQNVLETLVSNRREYSERVSGAVMRAEGECYLWTTSKPEHVSVGSPSSQHDIHAPSYLGSVRSLRWSCVLSAKITNLPVATILKYDSPTIQNHTRS